MRTNLYTAILNLVHYLERETVAVGSPSDEAPPQAEIEAVISRHRGSLLQVRLVFCQLHFIHKQTFASGNSTYGISSPGSCNHVMVKGRFLADLCLHSLSPPLDLFFERSFLQDCLP